MLVNTNFINCKKINLIIVFCVNILITGASGYIANHCARKLFSAGYSLFGIDLIPPQTTTLFQEFYTGDCGNIEQLRQITQDHPIDYVIYASGSTDTMDCENNPLPYYMNDVSGMLFTLSALRNTNGIIFLSCLQGDFPITTHQKIKNTVENILSSFHGAYNLSYIALRVTDVLGVHPQSESGPNNFHILRRLISPEPSLPAIIRRDYNFVHIEDVTEAVLCALNRIRTLSADYYDVAGKKWISIEQFAQHVEQCTHRKVTLPQYISPEVSNFSKQKIDTYRTQRELNWHLQYPDLDPMILSTVDWLRQHGKL